VQGLFVNVLRKNKKDVTGLVVFGFITLTYGFGLYYLLPLSLVSYNFQLATSIFMSILFGLMFSLALFSANMQSWLNLFYGRLTLFFESRSCSQLVLKNMIAHKERNKLTSIVFSVILGFIVFLSIVSQIPFQKEKIESFMHTGSQYGSSNTTCPWLSSKASSGSTSTRSRSSAPPPT